MLFATFLGVLLIPVFYVAVRRVLGDKLDEKPRVERETDPAEPRPAQ
jgi:multidrug efflux pump